MPLFRSFRRRKSQPVEGGIPSAEEQERQLRSMSKKHERELDAALEQMGAGGAIPPPPGEGGGDDAGGNIPPMPADARQERPRTTVQATSSIPTQADGSPIASSEQSPAEALREMNLKMDMIVELLRQIQEELS